MQFIKVNKSLIHKKLKFPLFTESKSSWSAGVVLEEEDVIKLKEAGFTYVFVDEDAEESQCVLSEYVKNRLKVEIPCKVLRGIFFDKGVSNSLNFLLNSLETYDKGVLEHSLLTARMSIKLCEELNYGYTDMLTVVTAALIHDVGKCCIPIELLNSPGKLSSNARKLMKKHPWYSFEIIANILDTELAELAYTHHERIDGTGYPRKLNGAKISEKAKVIMIADIFSALTEKRPYKEPYSNEMAMNMVLQYFKAEYMLCRTLRTVVCEESPSALNQLTVW